MVEATDTLNASTQTQAPAEAASCVPLTTIVSVWLVLLRWPYRIDYGLSLLGG
jgi:hypothetical protein